MRDLTQTTKNYNHVIFRVGGKTKKVTSTPRSDNKRSVSVLMQYTLESHRRLLKRINRDEGVVFYSQELQPTKNKVISYF